MNQTNEPQAPKKLSPNGASQPPKNIVTAMQASRNMFIHSARKKNAYRMPLYQVLDLSPGVRSSVPSPRRNGEAASMGDILKSILGGAQ